MNKKMQLLISFIFVIIATKSVAQTSNKDTLKKSPKASSATGQPLMSEKLEDSVDFMPLPKPKEMHARMPVRTRSNTRLKDTVNRKFPKKS